MESNEEITETKETKLAFIKRQLNKLRGFLMTTTSGMALGMFSTLIIGTILGQVESMLPFDFILYGEVTLPTILKGLMGVGIAAGIAASLKLPPLQLIGAILAGAISTSLKSNNNPLLIFFVVILTIELFKLIFRKKTPVDILLIPLFYALVSYGIAWALYYPCQGIIDVIADFISWSTERQPFLMGMLISMGMGMCLTAPISSVAIAVSIQIDGIAAGAAVVGCSCQMIGFAIQSIRDNNVGKVISVGIGTSMLQFKNIMRKPIIWLPTILASAILGPISTMVFKMQATSVGAGMGTCGLVGQINTIGTMESVSPWLTYGGIAILHFVGPCILVFLFDFILRKLHKIEKGDFVI